MTRLTDERLAEILRPKELIGETELESLAREVRELRESHSVACETCDGLRDSNHELRAENVRLGGEIRSLTTERLDLEERLFKANRQIEEFEFKQENYRRGFEAAKVAAQMIADEEFVRRNGLGNMAMVADFIRRKIEKLTPEVTE